MKNRDLVFNQQKERFKENLKFCIYDGACLLSMDELTSVCKDVFAETLSFLASEAKSN